MTFTFRVWGDIDVKVSVKEIEEFITTVLTNTPYWAVGNWLSKGEVLRFLDGDVDHKLLDRVSEYMLMWAENIRFSAYLLSLAFNNRWTNEDKRRVLEELKELRKLVKKIKKERDLNRKHELTKKLLSKLIDKGLDPF